MKAPIEWYKGKGEGGGERGWKGAMPPLQKFNTLSKIWRSTAWLASKGQSQKYSSPQVPTEK